MSDNRTDHTTLGGSTFCSPSLQGVWCCKNVTLNHAKAWQLIVNEFLTNTKVLNLLYFLKKIKAYAHISRIFTHCTYPYHAYMHTSRVGGHGSGGEYGVYVLREIHRRENSSVNHKGN